MSTVATVFVVDDDPGIQKSLRWLIESTGHSVQTYGSAGKFLDTCEATRVGCLILDVHLPGMSGLDLQDELNAREVHLPVIFLTGHGEVPDCSRAFRAGAVDYLEKPVDRKLLLRGIRKAMDLAIGNQRKPTTTNLLLARKAQLPPRQREVLDLLLVGKQIKQIAFELGVSIQTVTKHRSLLLTKFHVENDVQLVNVVRGFSPSDTARLAAVVDGPRVN